ncbi:MAG: hypothetical protein K2H01_02600 [Ruminococcus sp.]|nr:hypothetical protein [Ruminococcus sp.]
MKNDDEMYRSILSRYEKYQEKKKRRIRTIRRTVPVFACFCFTVVFGLRFWDDLAKLSRFPIQPDIVDEPMIESSESTTAADTTESSSTDQAIVTNVVSTTISAQNSEIDIVATTGKSQTQTVTIAVSGEESGRETEQEASEHRETQAPVTTAPVVETKPIIEVQTTSPVQTTVEPPNTIVTETELVGDNDSRLLYPIGKQVSIEGYKVMAAASYMIYNDIETSTTTSEGTATTQTTATIPSEMTTTTVTTDDRQTALEKLAEKEHSMIGELQRERAVILGELSPDAKRITLDEVIEIIESSSTYDEICKKLHEAQPYADYYGGSGVTLVEYWFDDKGSKKIFLILEQEEVFYYHFKEADKIYS